MNIFDHLPEEIQLSETEKNIMQYIQAHLEEVPEMSSRVLAKNTYTSSTVVLRFIKKLGFKNYNDFKLNISSYLKNIELDNVRIEGNEDDLIMLNKLTELEINTIKKTKEMLRLDTLSNVIRKLEKTKYIDIIASDANSDIANYAKHNFYFVGKITTIYSAKDGQLYLSLLSPKDHVVIVLSKYEQSHYILDAAKILKKRGVCIIGFISENSIELKNICNYLFYCAFDHSLNKLGDLVFNISTKYLFDLFFAILFSKHYDDTIELEKIHNRLYHRRPRDDEK